MWKDEIQLAIEEKKLFTKKSVEHYIESKKHLTIIKEMTQSQRGEDWDKYVKKLERVITGTQRRGFKIFKKLQLQERN